MGNRAVPTPIIRSKLLIPCNLFMHSVSHNPFFLSSLLFIHLFFPWHSLLLSSSCIVFLTLYFMFSDSVYSLLIPLYHYRVFSFLSSLHPFLLLLTTSFILSSSFPQLFTPFLLHSYQISSFPPSFIPFPSHYVLSTFHLHFTSLLSNFSLLSLFFPPSPSHHFYSFVHDSLLLLPLPFLLFTHSLHWLLSFI